MNNDLLAATTLACNRLQAQLSASSIADDAVSPRTAPLPRALAAAPGTRLPHALRVVDHQIDGMIRSLEHELRTSPHLRRPTENDLSADALGAQLQKVLAGSRLRVERQVFCASLRQAEAEASASAARERDLRAQLSVTQLLTSDLASLGDQLRVAKNKLKARDAEAGEVVAAADELQQQSVGLAAALAETRATATRCSRSSNRGAPPAPSSSRDSPKAPDARLSPPPRGRRRGRRRDASRRPTPSTPPPTPPTRRRVQWRRLDGGELALARTRPQGAFGTCVAVGVTGAAVARRVADRVTELTAQLAAADAARAELDGELQAAARAPPPPARAAAAARR